MSTLVTPRIRIALALMLWLSGPAQARVDETAADDPGALARQITSGARFQTELPDKTEPTRPDPPPWLGPIARLLLYSMLAVVLVLLAGWATVELRRSRATRRAATDAAGPRRGESRDLPRRLPSPLRLADEGRFTEAIHALLLVAFSRLAGRYRGRPQAALTSRELLRELSLDEPEHGALEQLVRAVELTHFGGKAAAAEDYATCLSSFRGATGGEPA